MNKAIHFVQENRSTTQQWGDQGDDDTDYVAMVVVHQSEQEDIYKKAKLKELESMEMKQCVDLGFHGDLYQRTDDCELQMGVNRKI